MKKRHGLLSFGALLLAGLLLLGLASVAIAADAPALAGDSTGATKQTISEIGDKLDLESVAKTAANQDWPQLRLDPFMRHVDILLPGRIRHGGNRFLPCEKRQPHHVYESAGIPGGALLVFWSWVLRSCSAASAM